MNHTLNSNGFQYFFGVLAWLCASMSVCEVMSAEVYEHL
jgi:hypothetical protein